MKTSRNVFTGSRQSPVIIIFIALLALSKAVISHEAITNDEHKQFITLIIDDIGNHLRLGRKAVRLQANLTYAVLPHRPFAVPLAKEAYARGKEVMLHMPMSNILNKALGSDGLTMDMERVYFMRTLRSAIASVPYMKGVNNHMGSLLTQYELPMEWLMEELKNQNLYFIDSRTSSLSVADKIAQNNGIPSLSRNIFLDDKYDPSLIQKQFPKMLQLAKNKGYIVAICHPFPETLAYLETHLPDLKKAGIELISPSRMMELKKASTQRPSYLIQHTTGAMP